MTNFERYNALHDEVMKRLEDGEITTEQAKNVIDLSFDKYITESVVTDSAKKAIQWIKTKTQSLRNKMDLMLTRDTFAIALKKGTNKLDDPKLKAEFRTSIKKCSDELAQLADTYCRKIDVVPNQESDEGKAQVQKLEEEYKAKLKQTINKYPVIASNMKEEQ